MKTVVMCMTHIRDMQDARQLWVWLGLLSTLNMRYPALEFPFDILIVDSASIIQPRVVISRLNWPWQKFSERLLNNDDEIPVISGNTIVRFRNALGHPVHDKIDRACGPDRAWMKGIEIAIASGYDRYVYIEADIMYLKPIGWAFDQMTKPVATGGPIAGQSFDEVGVFFAQTEYLWKSNFVARYDWRGPTTPDGESRMMTILGDDREVLPLRGNRDERRTAPEDFEAAYPECLDYLTHATPETSRRFLEINELGSLWPKEN